MNMHTDAYLLIVLCLCAEVISSQSPLRDDSVSNIIRSTPDDKNVYSVTIGEIEYGQIEGKRVQFVMSDDASRQMHRVKRFGCGMCSGVKIVDCNLIPGTSTYQCRLIFDHSPERALKLGPYNDVFQILDAKDSILGQIHVSYSLVLSKRVLPNAIQVKKARPQTTYRVELKKTGSFPVLAVRTDNPQMQVTHWHDAEKALEIGICAQHTYENKQVGGNLLIQMSPQEHLTVPLTMDIEEYIEVRPRSVFLGVLPAGQKVERRIAVISKEKLHLSKCYSELPGCTATVTEVGDYEAHVNVVFTAHSTLKKGPIKGFLRIETNTTGLPIEIPIYGVIVAATE